ncbi:MAG: hypothetical protein KJ950_12650 [Proteobacteria bacterium]|nr:hypothetical protein [Pseudomonadota bacterium]MBU1686199.1 hypothetical protein [Pseudomonadota bacterium]
MISIERDIEKKLTTFLCQGAIIGDEIMTVIHNLFESPSLHENVLWDFSDADSKDLHCVSILGFAELVRKNADKRSGGKTAIVAPQGVEFGLARMFETLVVTEDLPYEMSVFQNRIEAMGWLFPQQEAPST